MVELIDKAKLLEAYDKLPVQKVALVDCGDAYRTRPLVDLSRVNNMILSQSTIIVEEIRAEVIDEFAKAMKKLNYEGKLSWFGWGEHIDRAIDETAKQLMEYEL